MKFLVSHDESELAALQRSVPPYNDAIAARHPSRRAVAAGVAAALATVMLPLTSRAAPPIKLVALGDSLTAGYGVSQRDAFPTKLQAALRDKGRDVTVANAGVSGDTATGGADRLDWSVPDGTDGVIIELGANDMLRGIDPKVTRAALVRILDRLKARGIPAMLAGMRASRSLGAEYAQSFDRIYADLARERGLLLFPFFLTDVAGERALNQGDGMHPNPKGVDMIVKNILPSVERFLDQIGAAQR